MEMERSSSVDLSSAPASDSEPPNFDPFTRPHLNGSESHQQKSDSHRNSSAAAGSTAASGPVRQDQAPPPKKPRKPRTTKPKNPTAPNDAPVKEKVSRKPRISGTTAASRKKTKTESNEGHNSIQSIPQTTDLQSSKLNQPITLPSYPNSEPQINEAAKTSQNGFSIGKRENTMPAPSLLSTPQYNPHPPVPPQPQPNSSRSTPMYDPVRGLTSHRPVDNSSTSQSLPPVVHTPPRPASRPGASPISSIIDPIPVSSLPGAPSSLRNFISNPAQQTSSTNPYDQTKQTQSYAGAMEVDVPATDIAPERKSSITKRPTSETPTRATSPKPTRAKEQPPPMPTGSGLLSASLFGGESGLDSNENKTTGPNIVLHVDLKDSKNKVINFARMAEEKYGFAALYPRQAAQRERLARVAAAGAALERSASASKHGGTSAEGSGDDDGSVDIDRDSDNDGDIHMDGLNGGNEPLNSGTDGAEPKRKRRKKVEEYDQEDPFIDDSEQLWEAQAAASKDGFFVYCGPLVPEGEKPAVERADGTVRRGRGGRGRGGGVGSRGGRGGGRATAGDGDANGRPTTGPGSRGGNITRKPRMKKADRLQTQLEKESREASATAGVATAKPQPTQAELPVMATDAA